MCTNRCPEWRISRPHGWPRILNRPPAGQTGSVVVAGPVSVPPCDLEIHAQLRRNTREEYKNRRRGAGWQGQGSVFQNSSSLSRRLSRGLHTAPVSAAPMYRNTKKKSYTLYKKKKSSTLLLPLSVISDLGCFRMQCLLVFQPSWCSCLSHPITATVFVLSPPTVPVCCGRTKGCAFEGGRVHCWGLLRWFFQGWRIPLPVSFSTPPYCHYILTAISTTTVVKRVLWTEIKGFFFPPWAAASYLWLPSWASLAVDIQISGIKLPLYSFGWHSVGNHKARLLLFFLVWTIGVKHCPVLFLFLSDTKGGQVPGWALKGDHDCSDQTWRAVTTKETEDQLNGLSSGEMKKESGRLHYCRNLGDKEGMEL